MPVEKSVSVADIVAALQALGGQALVAEIKDDVQRRIGGVPSNYASDYTFRNTIQKLIEDHCPQSANHRPSRPALFDRIGHGFYRLIEPRPTLVADLAGIESNDRLEPTTRQRLVDARLGQGEFRANLISHWKACAITGIAVPAVLRASHIKPWHASNDQERLDTFNGLLLCANFDALFDAGLISFADSGSILLASNFAEEQRLSLGVTVHLRLAHVSEQHKVYLAFHRDSVLRASK